VEQQWRKHIRSQLDIPLEFQGKVSSLTQNISQSGMLCRTSREIDELTLLDIKFQLPYISKYEAKKIWIECSGVVVRCEKKEVAAKDLPYEVAIFFNHMSTQNRNLLATYVSKDN